MRNIHYITVDTGFWFALFNHEDAHHDEARDLWSAVKFKRIMLPWPSLYEAVNTQFAENRIWMRQFNAILKGLSADRFINDETYRREAFQLTFEGYARRPLSLVDHVIRRMIADKNLRIDCLLTFDKKDFSDVCLENRVSINLKSEYAR